MLKVLNLILFSSATRMHSSTWICRLSTDFWTDNNSCHQSAQLSLFHTFSCFTYLSDSSKLKSGHCWLGVSTSPITFHQYLFLSPRLISQLVLGALYVSKTKSHLSVSTRFDWKSLMDGDQTFCDTVNDYCKGECFNSEIRKFIA